jgi:hypothetical protein
MLTPDQQNILFKQIEALIQIASGKDLSEENKKFLRAVLSVHCSQLKTTAPTSKGFSLEELRNLRHKWGTGTKAETIQPQEHRRSDDLPEQNF